MRYLLGAALRMSSREGPIPQIKLLSGMLKSVKCWNVPGGWLRNEKKTLGDESGGCAELFKLRG